MSTLLAWLLRPGVVQDLRQHLCKHCWHTSIVRNLRQCCWCGQTWGEEHGSCISQE